MKLQDLLLMYSEWLDGEGLMEDPADTAHTSASHEDLAALFLAEHERTAVAQEEVPWEHSEAVSGEVPHEGGESLEALEGFYEPRLGLATTAQLIGELAARADVAATVGEDWPHYKTAGPPAPRSERQAAMRAAVLHADDVVRNAPEISTFPKGY